MSVPKLFIISLALIVFTAILWAYVLKPAFTRFSNYFYLFFILSKIRPYDNQDVRIKCASRLIQYDQVVKLMGNIRKQPILTTKEVNFSRKILTHLRSGGYSEVSILRATVSMLRQFTAQGFDVLPQQVMDSEIMEIVKTLEQKLATETDFKPVEVVFFILLGNKNLVHYLK